MKLVGWLLVAIGVIALVLFAWKKLPGLRTKVSDTVDEYGGWTEEARASDPVGFIEYAEARLREDKVTFQTSRASLAESKRNAEAERARTERLLATADELAVEFKVAYQAADASDAWPVEIKGGSYDREQLVEQVASILEDRATYEKVIGIYTEVVDSAGDKDVELKDRIQSIDATLRKLEAQKELVRIDQLSAEGDDLLAKVDALMGKNSAALGTAGTPVRSVEELLGAADKPSSGSVDALSFLED